MRNYTKIISMTAWVYNTKSNEVKQEKWKTPGCEQQSQSEVSNMFQTQNFNLSMPWCPDWDIFDLFNIHPALCVIAPSLLIIVTLLWDQELLTVKSIFFLLPNVLMNCSEQQYRTGSCWCPVAGTSIKASAGWMLGCYACSLKNQGTCNYWPYLLRLDKRPFFAFVL